MAPATHELPREVSAWVHVDLKLARLHDFHWQSGGWTEHSAPSLAGQLVAEELWSSLLNAITMVMWAIRTLPLGHGHLWEPFDADDGATTSHHGLYGAADAGGSCGTAMEG